MISEREKGIYLAVGVGQTLLLAAGFALTYWFFDVVRDEWIQTPTAYSQLLSVMVLAMIAESIARPEKFRIDAGRLPRRLAFSLARRQAVWVLGAFALLVVLGRDHSVSRLFLLTFTCIAFGLFYYSNRFGWRWMHRYFPFGSLQTKLRTLVVGSDEWRTSVLKKIEAHRDLFEILPSVAHQPGSPEAPLVAAVERASPDLLVFPAREISYDTASELFALGDRRGFRCWVPVELSRRHGRQFELQDMGGIDMLTPPTWPLSEPLNRALKRSVDVVLSLAGIMLLVAPMALVVAALQRMQSKGSLFTRRPVVGENGAIFEALDFRTAPQDGDNTATSNYAGAKFLRRCSLHTLPRLVNVLRGQMSIIGPSAHDPVEAARLQQDNEFYGLRRFVKPGLSGLAQLSRKPAGRERVDATARHAARYDRFYTKHWSLGLDMRCLFGTLTMFFLRSRASG